MRHRIYGKRLGRNKNERQTLFKGLVYSLLSNGTIQTSEVKAKAIKGLVDKIINLTKRDLKVSGQPTVNFFLTNKILRGRIKDEIIPKLGTRVSGYTKLVKLGSRLGDQTMMVQMSLIGAEQLSVPSSQLSDKGKSVVSKSVTDKQRTGKQITENRLASRSEQLKTDNRKIKKSTSRSKNEH